MFTLFSCPKPFHGHTEIIQRNAIRTWIRLDPKPEVLLIGKEEGAADVAKELNVRYLPHVPCNDYGTPLVNSIFAEAEKAATYEIMCYVNVDIILMSDFTQAIREVWKEKPRCLMVGRRYNLDMKEELDFQEDWEERLTAQVAREGKLNPPFAVDYFVFPKGVWGEVPPFAIGRPAWDNWILYRACQLGLPIVDLTPSVTAIHQNHDYSHHPGGWEGAMRGEESRRNIELAGEVAHVYSLLDAQYCLTRRGLRRKIPPYYVPFFLYRTLVVLSASHPFLKPLVRLVRNLGQRLSTTKIV